MLYLTQTLFVPWLLAALALGLLVGWRASRRTPWLIGLGWLGAGGAIFVIALFLAGALVIPGRSGLWFDTALHFLFWYVVGCCAGSLAGLYGVRDETTEPVAAWVRPVRSDAAAVQEPGEQPMANWVRVLPQAGTPGPVPALEAARAWLGVLRQGSEDPTARVPDWVRPVLPARSAPAMAPAKPEALPKPQPPAARIPDWVRPILPASTPAAVAAMPAPATNPQADAAQWQAVRAADGVTITGHVADEKARTKMLSAAKKALGPLAITERLQIAPGQAGMDAMTTAAFGHLAKLDRGIASLVGKRYTLTGFANRAADREAVMAAIATLPKGFSLAHADLALSAPGDGPDEATLEGERPAAIATARNGKGDDLKRVRGIGRQNESRLNGLGIWHFDQIAAWTPDNARWVGSYLAFPGRIEREDWVGQAKLLAAGGETEFSKRVDKGQVSTSRS